MRPTVFTVFTMLIIGVAAVFAQDIPVDFSGCWILSQDKSELGDAGGGRGGRGMAMAASKMIVTREKNTLTVESFRKNRDGEETSNTATYTLDGKKCKNSLGNRGSISTVEWSEDGKSLIIRSETTVSRNDREFTMHSESTWSLLKGELVIETVRSTPMGERTAKAVYMLQKK